MVISDMSGVASGSQAEVYRNAAGHATVVDTGALMSDLSVNAVTTKLQMLKKNT